MTVTVLITRPRPAADGFAIRVRDRLGPDVAIEVSPLMRIEPVCDTLPSLDGVGALAVTSAHAIPVVAATPGAAVLPCYCVGTATAWAARDAGLAPIDAGGTAGTLAQRILADAPPGKVLYPRGEHVASDLAQTLSRAGLETHDIIVYRQTALPLTMAARSLLAAESPVILPLFSPRSARLPFETVTPRAPIFVAAMSARVAAAVPQATHIRIAETPDAEAMLDCIAALASEAKRVESGLARK